MGFKKKKKKARTFHSVVFVCLSRGSDDTDAFWIGLKPELTPLKFGAKWKYFF